MIHLHPDYRFIWIGDFGEDREAHAVAQLLKKADHPTQIEVTGWVRNPRDYLAGLDVFCMFSRYESFGYVTAESMLLGVPVVATPATGTVDLVQHERTGLLAEARSKEIILALDRMKNDAELRETWAANAKRLVEQEHTVEKMVSATEALYFECLP